MRELLEDLVEEVRQLEAQAYALREASRQSEARGSELSERFDDHLEVVRALGEVELRDAKRWQERETALRVRMEEAILEAHERLAAMQRKVEAARRSESEIRSVIDAYERSRMWRLLAPLRRLRGWNSDPKKPAPDVPTKTVREPERPRTVPVRRARAIGSIGEVDVVVCVHNAMEETERCLRALSARTLGNFGLIVVDDGSDRATRRMLESHCRKHGARLIRNREALGYTKAANLGLAASSADAVVLLNSDTRVTTGWLLELVRVAETEGAGIVGPLSNSATWQSVPSVSDEAGWSTNAFPTGWDEERIALLLRRRERLAAPRVHLLNGFCLLIHRAVLDTIGNFDEAAFPRGYGEENDYCLRAKDAGFELAVATRAYVFHEKSSSYSAEGRKPLAEAGRKNLERLHGKAKISGAVETLRDSEELAEIRDSVRGALAAGTPAWDDDPLRRGVLFVLPVKGGGGGVHSIVQEAHGMRLLGTPARIAVPAAAVDNYIRNYPGMPRNLFVGFDAVSELTKLADECDCIVGTIFTSMKILAQLKETRNDLSCAYYIQDYEPWIVEKGSAYEEEAEGSYNLISDALLFAKTRWLCDTVASRHDVKVAQVLPSLDSSVYYPAAKPAPEPMRICAMVRPRTPRRAPELTVRILERLIAEFGEGIEVEVFGCGDDELTPLRSTTSQISNRGLLRREGVAAVLRRNHLFLDLSTYQAFGRTAVEAMACGCAVAVPELGGAPEMCRQGETGILVDTSDEEAVMTAVRRLVADPSECVRLGQAAQLHALSFNILRSAASELSVLREHAAQRLG